MNTEETKMRLDAEFLSRLGKVCEKRADLVNRVQKVAVTSHSHETRPNKSKQVTVLTPTLDLFKYHQSIKKELKEEEDRKKKETKNAKATFLKPDKELTEMDIKSLNQSPAFKTTKRKPLGSYLMSESNPVIGQYNPHYNYILRSNPKWKISTTSYAKTGVTSSQAESPEQVAPVEILRKSVNGNVKFDTQVNRKGYYDGQGPHESRFEPFDHSPPISTNNKKLQWISLEKTTGRSPNVFHSKLTSLMYTPKFDLIYKRILVNGITIGSDKGSIIFSKMPKKEIGFSVEPAYLKDSSDPEKISKYFSYIRSTDSSPKFDKQFKIPDTARFPRYFSGLNNRLGVTTLNASGLKASNYQNSKLAAAISSFHSKNGSIKKTKPRVERECFTLTKTLEDTEKMLSKIQVNHLGKSLSDCLLGSL